VQKQRGNFFLKIIIFSNRHDVATLLLIATHREGELAFNAWQDISLVHCYFDFLISLFPKKIMGLDLAD